MTNAIAIVIASIVAIASCNVVLTSIENVLRVIN